MNGQKLSMINDSCSGCHRTSFKEYIQNLYPSASETFSGFLLSTSAATSIFRPAMQLRCWSVCNAQRHTAVKKSKHSVVLSFS